MSLKNVNNWCAHCKLALPQHIHWVFKICLQNNGLCFKFDFPLYSSLDLLKVHRISSKQDKNASLFLNRNIYSALQNMTSFGLALMNHTSSSLVGYKLNWVFIIGINCLVLVLVWMTIYMCLKQNSHLFCLFHLHSLEGSDELQYIL